MNQNLSYLSLPQLPSELIPDVYESLKGTNMFPVATEQYKGFRSTDRISKFTESIFDFPHYTAIQIIKDFLIIHTDIFRTTAFNYVIDPGGEDVETCFYDNNDLLIESYRIEPNKWHKLNVQVRHNVVNLVRPRISITVHSIDEIPLQYRW